MLAEALEGEMLPALQEIESTLEMYAKQYAGTPMLARTHGQPASPTTFGKEMRVFLERIRRQTNTLQARTIMVKWGGATGNWNAHVVAKPGTDWVAFAKSFIESLNAPVEGKGRHIKLELNPVTTQIEPH